MCSFFPIFKFVVIKLFIIFYYISLYLVTIDNAVFAFLLFTNALPYSFCPSLAGFVSCFVLLSILTELLFLYFIFFISCLAFALLPLSYSFLLFSTKMIHPLLTFNLFTVLFKDINFPLMYFFLPLIPNYFHLKSHAISC